MQKRGFFWSLTLVMVFCGVGRHWGEAHAQDEPWRQMYRQGNWIELKAWVQEGKVTNPCWQQFLQAIFLEQADSAIGVWASLVKQCSDKEIRRGIRDRVSRYYYARGYYETAERIQNDDDFFQKILAIRRGPHRFGVQLGAFRTYRNALNWKQKWEGKIHPLQIVNKTRAGRRLYTVVGGMFRQRSEAENFRRRLKRQFGIDGYVIAF